MLSCAETVEDGISLWKEKEKMGEIPATDFTDEHG
jgi:hypothetical protein